MCFARRVVAGRDQTPCYACRAEDGALSDAGSIPATSTTKWKGPPSAALSILWWRWRERELARSRMRSGSRMRHGEEKTADAGIKNPKPADPCRDAAVFFMDARESRMHASESRMHASALRMHAAVLMPHEKNLRLDTENSGIHAKNSRMHGTGFLLEAQDCRMDAETSCVDEKDPCMHAEDCRMDAGIFLPDDAAFLEDDPADRGSPGIPCIKTFFFRVHAWKRCLDAFFLCTQHPPGMKRIPSRCAFERQVPMHAPAGPVRKDGALLHSANSGREDMEGIVVVDAMIHTPATALVASTISRVSCWLVRTARHWRGQANRHERTPRQSTMNNRAPPRVDDRCASASSATW